MQTARRYLAREIYRSTSVVLIALLGLFTFFTLVDELDTVNARFPLSALFYLQGLSLPTRLYDLLPIGLLIGAILALSGLAQRNELVILRVSGVSGLGLLRMLWTVSIPIILGALILSEFLTPLAEIKSSEVNLLMRGRVEGGRLASGYWFKEPTPNGGTRLINVGKLLASGNVENLSIYEFPDGLTLSVMTQAKSGKFVKGKLEMQEVVETHLDANIKNVLADAKVTGTPAATVKHLPLQTVDTSLSSERLVARILTPERMSLVALHDYIDYLNRNQLQADRQIVAVWRKMAYPFTLLVMLTIAAPISFMQTRRGGVGAKVFLGILLGTGFFMINQLALNVSLLFNWPPVVTALLPNIGAMTLALTAVFLMENRNAIAQRNGGFFFSKKSPI
ncbi:LPS export ABC transporter permease LptG [Alcaligenaceae bacterium LF4-65]|uniref:LPS export ABC transporter permease LptG n=1 Tax=Zwartia hollandica TaxID=324606 RepID=A0A953N8Z6_9BURK|nr:LPS export ABC transporter permease LptG [Zwartia hollandica]MBZ1350409.1 LPS export ABC transporter permease LptG [Zwartia hollandica]